MVVLSVSFPQNPVKPHPLSQRSCDVLVAPELLFNFWEVLFFSPQGLGQRPGTAGGLQVLGFIGAIAALLLIRIDIDAVQTSKEQQQCQDDND